MRRSRKSPSLKPTISTDFDKALTVATQRHMAGDRATAESMYHQLMAVQPNHPFLNFALGTFYIDAEKMGLSIPLLMRAAELDPANAQVWNNLGAAFKAAFQTESAEDCLDKAEKLDPRNQAVFANRSGLYINEGCPAKAIPWGEKGLLLDPDSPQLHNHLGLAYLELGQWTQAWPHWEWRVKLPGWYARNFPKGRLWGGDRVRNLALSGEQGIGDEILFASIIPEILPLVEGNLYIECTERLQSLFERSFPCRTFPSHQELLLHIKDIDAHLQLGSLPRLFRPTPESCPGTPFLKPDPVQVAEFRARLARLGPPPYVGLTWRGGTAKTHGHVRTIGLSEYGPIRAVEGCTFVSVQYGGGTALETASCNLPHWPDSVDFNIDRETALIASLDLLISVCQTAVHLAGGLGTPCWCLTPHKVAWRYGTFGGEKMPWYSSVRLFRQQPEEGWPKVIARVAEALQQWKAC